MYERVYCRCSWYSQRETKIGETQEMPLDDDTVNLFEDNDIWRQVYS